MKPQDNSTIMFGVQRKILYLILAFIFFLGAVTFYINKVTIPRYLKAAILQATQKYLGRNVTFKSISFNPLRGLVIDDVIIHENDSADVFASIGQATAGIHYIPLLLHRKVILSSFEIKNVSAHLIHYSEDQWNFTDIIERLSSARKPGSKSVPVYLSRVEMNGGKIKITDLEDGSQFSETFQDTAIKANLSMSKGIIFQMSTGMPQQQGWIETKGRYHLLNKTFKGQMKLKNVPLAQYIKLARQELPVTMRNIYINDANVTVTTGEHLIDAQGLANLKNLDLQWSDAHFIQAEALVMQKGNLSFNTGQIHASGTAWTKNAKLSLGPVHCSTANATIELQGLAKQDNDFYASVTMSLEQASFESPTAPAFEGHLTLKDFRVSQKDDTWTTTGDIQSQNSTITFTPQTKLSGNLSGTALTVTAAPQAITAKGRLDGENIFLQWPTGKELRGNITLEQLSIQNGPKLPWTGQANVSGTGVTIKLPNEQEFTADVTSLVSVKMLTAPVRHVDVFSNFQLRNSIFTMKNGVTFRGDPIGRLEVHSSDKPDVPSPYEGSFKLENAVLEGTKIGTISAVSGDITFKNDYASTPRLDFEALGMTADLKGKLQDFSKPEVDVKININQFDLTQAPKFVPDFFSQNKLTLEGIAQDVNVSYKGLITDAANADIRFTGTLEDASAFCGRFNQSASKLFGRVDYRRNFFAWKNLKALYNNRNLVLTGKITDFKSPSVETTVDSRNLKMTTHFDFTPDLITFKKLHGVYEKMVFDVEGTSRPSGDGRPMLDLSGDVDLDLKHLNAILPTWDEKLKPYKLSGRLKIKGDFHGDPVHWQDWRLNLTGGSPQFFIWGLKIRDMKFNFVQKDNHIKPFHIWGNFYGGDFNSIASVDLAKKEMPFEMAVKLNDTQLRQLKIDTPLKKQDIDGNLSSTALLEGSLADLGNFRGKGGVQIKDGRLWEVDLLKGLGGILLIPEYKDITFEEAGMNFTINQRTIATENLQLLSKSLTLYGRGQLDFDQNLNLVLSPDFNSDVIAGSSSLKKGSTAIIAQTEKFMTIDVTGTLSQPQYKVNKSPGRILQKTGGVILENVSGFFKSIF